MTKQAEYEEDWDAGPAARAGDWLAGAFSRNPEAFLVLAAGAALLLRRGGSHFMPADAHPLRTARDMAASYAGSGQRRLRREASRIGRQGARLKRRARAAGETMHEQPLAVAAFGLAAGAAVAAMLPRLDIEERALGPAREAFSDAAARTFETVKEAAGEAGKRAQQGVVEHGVAGLKDIARDAAEGFGEKMSASLDDNGTTGLEGRGGG
jgi:hypothetical protein